MGRVNRSAVLIKKSPFRIILRAMSSRTYDVQQYRVYVHACVNDLAGQAHDMHCTNPKYVSIYSRGF